MAADAVADAMADLEALFVDAGEFLEDAFVVGYVAFAGAAGMVLAKFDGQVENVLLLLGASSPLRLLF